ncbi:DNA-formamidopyrimidine glycosylase family protein [Sanguibacter sp. HDW7]|uniref:DNA-formamidopyrimidine glycosylase family protein n=1 Tax=Sanguibacter sp. HDW7 TaxID=2714931 RepID=UPI0014097899|nr:DNA-formamidopyrimidine glycosylase family protein [Sanguibacter sp. HDW7]QIK83273.1 Fpg/Nei family DNA glycosylase [Sanguibacter sp. HDW7]
MPEGDVLRLTAARLDAALRGAVLVRAELRWADLGDVDLTGREVTEVTAYGKNLLVRTTDGWTVHAHLRMEGRWYVARTGTPEASGRAPHVRAVLASARWTALGENLGMLHVVRTRDEGRLLGHLGPDLLADDLDVPAAALRLRDAGDGPGVSVAEALLDQRRVAGIGTIYAAESLFARRTDPWRTVGTLGPDELAALLLTARTRMARVVAHGLGALDARAHGRVGRPCVRCRTAIAVGQARRPPFERPIFYCPRCQAPQPGVSRSV